MKQQKVDHRLLGHFNKLGFFDDLGSKRKSLEDVEDMMNSLEEKHLPAKTQRHLRTVCAQKGPDKYKTAIRGALSNFRGAAGEILCNADAILRGDKNLKRGEKISRQKREEYDMALKKPESGGDYECRDALLKVDKLIQTKWYSKPNKTIYLQDVSTSLVDGLNWPILELWTNAEKVDSDVAKKKNITVVSRLALEKRFTKEYLSNIKNIIKESVVKPPKPLSPRVYQKAAIRAGLKHFKKFDRGQLNVPCAWGKTLTGLWLAEGLGSKKTLALCPSKDLCGQIFAAWLANGNNKYIKRIVVCSDESILYDSIVNYEDELDFVVVKDVDKLKELTQDCDEYQVISTYQSISKLIEADLSFDFGFFDEAHRTTQPNNHLFALGLFDSNIKIKKRLFATATRRFVSGRHQSNTMEDESVYGSVFFRETFASAVGKGIISPVKIVTNKITNEELNKELIKHGVTPVGWDIAQTRMVACIIGFLKAIDHLNIKKSFIYTNKVESAERVAGDSTHSISQFTDKIKTFHVNGRMRGSVRKREFTSFLEAEFAAMTNARCLNEGVDCPVVDCVAFFNPRKSVIDIIQSVGRAMRIDENNPDKVGYIYVPIFEDVNENTDEALYNSPYEVLADVIRAMASHDDSLDELLNTYIENIGGGDGGGGSFPDLFEIIAGDNVDLNQLQEDIISKLTSVFRTSRWSLWRQNIGLAKKIKEKFGHVNFHNPFITSSKALGVLAEDPLITLEYKRWVRHKIKHPDSLSKSQLEELTELDFEFDPALRQWKVYAKLISNVLKKYLTVCGHGTSNIDWDKAKDNLDEWSEGHIKCLEDFEEFKSAFGRMSIKIAKAYDNTVNDNSSTKRKPRSKCKLPTSYLEESQIEYLKEIEWTPKTISDHAEDAFCNLVEKCLEESKNMKKRGGNRWDWKNHVHRNSIRAEEISGKVIFPNNFTYEGVALGTAINTRRRPQKARKNPKREIARLNAEARRQKTLDRLKDMGVWLGGDSFTYRNEGGVNQDEFVWQQSLENWRRVDAGLTDSEEDVKYAKSFSLSVTTQISKNTLSETQKKLLKKYNWKSHQTPQITMEDRLQKEIDVLTKMNEDLGHTLGGGRKTSRKNGSQFDDEVSRDRYNAIVWMRQKYKENKLTKEQITWIENNFNYWDWSGKEAEKSRFMEKVSLCKIWLEENPNAKFIPAKLIVENPHPFTYKGCYGDKYSQGKHFDIGSFLAVCRRNKNLPPWQTKTLNKELGKIWKISIPNNNGANTK